MSSIIPPGSNDFNNINNFKQNDSNNDIKEIDQKIVSLVSPILKDEKKFLPQLEKNDLPESNESITDSEFFLTLENFSFKEIDDPMIDDFKEINDKNVYVFSFSEKEIHAESLNELIGNKDIKSNQFIAKINKDKFDIFISDEFDINLLNQINQSKIVYSDKARKNIEKLVGKSIEITFKKVNVYILKSYRLNSLFIKLQNNLKFHENNKNKKETEKKEKKTNEYKILLGKEIIFYEIKQENKSILSLFVKIHQIILSRKFRIDSMLEYARKDKEEEEKGEIKQEKSKKRIKEDIKRSEKQQEIKNKEIKNTNQSNSFSN